MQADETALTAKYNLIKLSVISSTQISSRAASVIQKLQDAPADGKPTLVALSSKTRTASKLVSIVEIAKRELARTGKKCFQYNALSSQMTECDRDSKSATISNKTTEANEDGSESDDAFETMGAEPKAGNKKRLLPVMTVYLSTSSVKELRNIYGEQT